MWNVLGSIQLLSGFGFSSSTFNQSYHDHPVVTVQNGTLIGIRDTRYDQDLFLGIPYAQPHVGNLRLNHLTRSGMSDQQSHTDRGVIPFLNHFPDSIRIVLLMMRAKIVSL